MTFLHPHHHHHSCSHNGADRLREQEARCPKPENSRQRAGVLVWFRLGSSRSRRSRGCSADEESPAASLPSTVPPLLPASTSHSAAPVSSPPASLPSLPANVIHCLCSSGDLLRQGKTANIYRSVRRGWWRAGVGWGGGGLWTDGGMVKVQHQMLSIGRKIRTRWPIMQCTHRAFTSYQCLTYYCHSLLLFVLEKKDKQKKKTDGFSFSKRRVPWTLSSLALTTSGLRSLSPPDITALALLRISSAGFEAHRWA